MISNKIKEILKSTLMFISHILFYNRKSKVLYLHDIHTDKVYAKKDCSMSLVDFKRIIETIRKEEFTIVKEITEEKNQIQICFDDGYRGIWDCRFYFTDNKIPVTIFVAINLIGKENYLSLEEIAWLAKKGFRIESHTLNHIALDKCHGNDLVCELEESKKFLENIIRKDIKGFCFPKGHYTTEALNLSGKFYKELYSSIPGNFYEMIDKKLIPRNLIQLLPPKQVRYTLYGGQSILRNRIKKQHYK